MTKFGPCLYLPGNKIAWELRNDPIGYGLVNHDKVSIKWRVSGSAVGYSKISESTVYPKVESSSPSHDFAASAKIFKKKKY